jgi:dTDP-glucose pyrophosphorylase
MNIVIPMAGRGSRFAEAGYSQPKPLIPISGRPMIEWVIENIRPSRPHHFIFLCLQEHLDNHPGVISKLKELCPSCDIVPVKQVTEGAACTVLLAKDIINSEAPLMIANSDQIVELSIDQYLAIGDSQGIGAHIMTFWADDPKWSYCRMREDGSVSEVVEKKVISNEATVGIYNFSHGCNFVHAAELMIDKNLRVNNEFYVAPCYNQLIEEGMKVIVGRTGREYDGMYGLGIPQDLAFFMTTKYFNNRVKVSRIKNR